MTLVDFKRIKGEMRIAFIMAVIVIVVAQKCSNRKVKNAMRLQTLLLVLEILLYLTLSLYHFSAITILFIIEFELLGCKICVHYFFILIFPSPFLQGLNAGLEDVFVLYQSLMNNDNDVKKGIYELYKRIIGQDIAFSLRCLFDHVRIFDNNKIIWNPYPLIIEIIISNISISHSLFLSLHNLFSPLFLSLLLSHPFFLLLSLPHTQTPTKLSLLLSSSHTFSHSPLLFTWYFILFLLLL